MQTTSGIFRLFCRNVFLFYHNSLPVASGSEKLGNCFGAIGNIRLGKQVALFFHGPDDLVYVFLT